MLQITFLILGDKDFFNNIFDGIDININDIQEETSLEIFRFFRTRGIEKKDIRYFHYRNIFHKKRKFIITILENTHSNFIEDKKVADNLSKVLSERIMSLTQLDVSCSVYIELAWHKALEILN